MLVMKFVSPHVPYVIPNLIMLVLFGEKKTHYLIQHNLHHNL